MANANTPFGLRPVRHMDGSHYNGATRLYYVPSSDSNAIYVGDPVIAAGSADADGIPTATIATAAGGAYITGAVVAVKPDTRDSTVYRTASVGTYILVADDPDLLFEIQEDAVGGALAAVDVGLNADLIAGSGSTVTGRSGWQLDTSTKATTNTLQLRIMEFVRAPDNAIGANAKVLVKLNLHSQRNLTGL